ncbi:hypothetical protein RB195_025559 [Necator americanus]|uniref:Uncharacterized protein n=1 Tax=Necator americanus TaxID=51031 RepID=A0ABR1EV53_NECAM
MMLSLKALQAARGQTAIVSRKRSFLPKPPRTVWNGWWPWFQFANPPPVYIFRRSLLQVDMRMLTET